MGLSPEMQKYLTDLGERTVATFVIGMLGTVVAAGPAGLFHASTWQAAAAGGMMALGSVLKGGVAFFRGKKSASMAKNV